MNPAEIMTVAASAAAVLGTLGATLRYLLRLAVTLESTSDAFQRHVSSSDELHRALTDRVTSHGEQLAALTARVEGLRQ
jgi:ABC-type transporter Mla subunit MlaD